MNEINLTLNDGHARGTGKGPRKTSKAKAGRLGGLKIQAARRSKKKFQPKAKFLDALPAGALKIKGIHKSYYFVPGLGMLSLAKEGRVRLLLTPKKEKASWTVKNTKGERLFIGRATLQERMGKELGV